MRPFLNGLRVGAVETVFGVLSVGKRHVRETHACGWVNGYVRSQSPLTDETGQSGQEANCVHPWGAKGSVEANGCGAVAVYNLLRGLGRPVALDALLEELERSGAPVLGGRFGSNCRVLAGVLRARGMSVRKLAGSRNWYRQVGAADGLLFLYRHPHGFHYVAGLRSADGQYTLWNDNVVAASGTAVTPEEYAGLLRRGRCGMYEVLEINK